MLCPGAVDLSPNDLIVFEEAPAAPLDKCAGLGFILGFIFKVSFSALAIELVDVSPNSNMARSCRTLEGSDSVMVTTGEVEVGTHLLSSSFATKHDLVALLDQVVTFC